MASAAESAKEQPAAKSGQAEMHKGADIKGGAAAKSGPQTTGSGAAEMKSDSKADAKGKAQTTGSSAEMKNDADHKADTKADSKSKPQTTGQSSTEQKSQAQQGKDAPSARSSTQDSKSSDSKSSAQDSKQTPSGSTAQGQQNQRNQSQPSTAQGQSQPNSTAPSTAQGPSQPSGSTAQSSQPNTQTGAAVNLTPDQKSQIRTTVLQSSSAPKVSRSSINFNISVGTVVPRTGVHIVTVPDTLVRIHPAWRGYSYFVVDDEIIIVEPSTYKIVAVLNV